LRTSALFDAKDFFGFSEIYSVSARAWKRELSQCGYFTGKSESISLDFVQTSFMDGP